MKKIILPIIFALLLANLLTGKKAWAQYYGGPVPSISFSLDKLVRNPDSGDFVDNLGVSDRKFSPGEEITFRLKVKNTGDEVLEDIQVSDVLPSYLDWVSGQSFPFKIDKLEVDERREFEFIAKVKEEKDLPAEPGIYCLINWAQAKDDDRADEDTAQVCLQKGKEEKVMGMVTMPEAGVNLYYFLLSSTALAILGFTLFKKTKEFI